MWLNNCVGRQNIVPFYALLLSAGAMLTVQIAVGFYGVIIFLAARDVFAAAVRGWMYAGAAAEGAFAGLAMFWIMSMIALGFIAQLIMFHAHLVARNLTTYEFIVQHGHSHGGAAAPALGSGSALSLWLDAARKRRAAARNAAATARLAPPARAPTPARAAAYAAPLAAPVLPGPPPRAQPPPPPKTPTRNAAPLPRVAVRSPAAAQPATPARLPGAAATPRAASTPAARFGFARTPRTPSAPPSLLSPECSFRLDARRSGPVLGVGAPTPLTPQV